MIALKDILYKVTINAVVGSTSVHVNAIQFDSEIFERMMYLLHKRNVVDGHNFIDTGY